MGELCPWDASAVPAEWNADGVVFHWQMESAACALLVPESGGLFPAPQAQGAWSPETYERMNDLAQAIAEAFGADQAGPQRARVAYGAPLTEVVDSFSLNPSVSLIPLNIRLDESTVLAHVLGPLAGGDEIAGSDLFLRAQPPPPPAAPPTPERAAEQNQEADEFEEGLRRLPAYARSLLKVAVPLSVTLAEKKQRLSEVTRLVPGSIIQFDKSCDEVLELRAANETIAVGEAVKVNDTFGLRITAMTLPGERFRSVGERGG
jgi:flagellar motor switch protein FliN/FliY